MSNMNDDIKELCAIIRSDHGCSLLMCGGDGEGCQAYRGYFKNRKHRWRKCSHCTMGVTQPMIDLVNKIESGLYTHTPEGKVDE